MKRGVITFDPTVSFHPIPSQIEGLDDSYRVLRDRTLIFRVLDSLFSILTQTKVRIKIVLGKLKSMSHNFRFDRQFVVYNTSNQKYRQGGRFDILSAEN